MKKTINKITSPVRSLIRALGGLTYGAREKFNAWQSGYDSPRDMRLAGESIGVTGYKMFPEIIKDIDKLAEGRFLLRPGGENDIIRGKNIQAKKDKEAARLKKYNSSGYPAGQEFGVGFGEPHPEDVSPSSKSPSILGASKAAKLPSGVQGIIDYAGKYKNSSGYSSRLTPAYMNNIWNQINKQFPKATQEQKENVLANVVAVALAETGMGADALIANPKLPTYRNTNFYGYFKGGDRNYDPKEPWEMARDIVDGLGRGYNIIEQDFNMDLARKYTGNDRAESWLNERYLPTLRDMGY